MSEDPTKVCIIVTIWVKPDADIKEVIEDMDYEFDHENIIATEISAII
jgi:hypothetical protein